MAELSLHDAIFTTRSMRHLKPDPVPRSDIEYMIEAATMAPSAGNMQI
jgi:nitroreductase